MTTLFRVSAVSLLAFLVLFPETSRALAQEEEPGDDIPRLANGKPSMAGFWGQVRRADVTDARLPGYVAELPFSDWGRQQWESYDRTDPEQGDYAGSCMPFGISRTIFGPQPLAIIQDEDHLVFLAEQNTWFHMVPTDGRPHDPELPPSWWGDSVGHWEGETLVIETRTLNGYAKVDTIGHPISSLATIIQTFRRVDARTIEHTYTLDDPGAYTRPWTVYNTWTHHPPGFRMMEYSCMEGNLQNLLNGVITPWFPPEE